MEARSEIPPEQIIDIQYVDILRDPMNVVREIYQYFGWPISEAALVEMTDEINSHGQHKHGRHHYTLEQFGYESDKIDARFAVVTDRQGPNFYYVGVDIPDECDKFRQRS